MFSFFYNLALFLYLLLISPKLFYEYLFLGKKRLKLSERLGFKNYNFEINKNKKVVWIHAVSVGEAKAAKTLIRIIKDKMPQAYVIVSSITLTGHNEAKRSLDADFYIFMPLDFSWAVKRVLSFLRPNITIFVETDLWYNFIKYSKKYGAKTVLVSAKMSDRSYKRFSKASFFSKRLFSEIDLICTQNNRFKQFFKSLSPITTKVVTTGNLKYDDEIKLLTNAEKEEWKRKFKAEESQILAISSTHSPEEELILSRLSSIWSIFPKLKVMLAPRHPERFLHVKELLKAKSIDFGLYSDLKNIKGTEKVILIDTMGFLNVVYQISDLAIVCGSFTNKVGGHNILEPVFVNTPVFFGPFMHAQKDLQELVLNKRCGKKVFINNLKEEILNFFTADKVKENMRVACSSMISSCKGSSDNTWKEIESIF